jgi:DNA-binding NtrC family response regulator
MVHGIVKNHEGRITCRSTPGKGTRFQIYLPAVKPIPQSKPVADKAVSLKGSETILLVDDDETIRFTGKETLENAGYRVLTASEGETALDVYGQEAGKIHLVLLDLIMPGMDGARCLQQLLQTDPAVNVAIISGHCPDDQTMQAMKTANSRYLRKPYSGEQLLRTVREALDNRRRNFRQTFDEAKIDGKDTVSLPA